MNKNTPRYKDKIFVTDKKHLTRTLNTYSQYESVLKIFITFNFEHNKYQLLLNSIDESASSALNYKQKMILVYERENSNTNLHSEEKILNILKTNPNLQKETIDAFCELIKKYTTSLNHNDFFINDENIIFEEIRKILPANLTKEYTTKDEDKSFKTNRAKAIYNLIKNQLLYSNMNKVHGLENQRKITKLDIDELINDEINIMEENMQSFMRYSFHYADNYNASKWEIQNAIENYYDSDYEKYNLVSFSLQELEEQLEHMETNEGLIPEEERLQDKNIENFAKSMKKHLNRAYKKEFLGYDNVITYCKKNQLLFRDSVITKYLNMIDDLYKETKKLTGLKRKKAIETLNKQYKYFLAMDSISKYYFKNKILRLHQFILKYKDKYKFSIDESYYRQLDLAECYTKKELKKLNLDWNKLDKELQKHIKKLEQEKKQKNELKKILEEQGITEEQYNFNIFYEKLLNHMDAMSQEYEWCCYNKPLTKSCFNEYLEFVSDIKSIEEWNAEMGGWKATNNNIDSCRDMKEEISGYIDEIYERIEEDLIAAGIDPNESEDDEYENEKNDESSVDIAVEKAYLFNHLPEDIRPFFINYYKNKNNPKKDEITEDDDEIPF